MDDMYNHEDDFEQYFGESTSEPAISVSLPFGETLAVNGHRQIPSIITISNKTERNPKRDARMLASVLTCSLDEQTVFHLAEYLFAEHLAPMMQESRNLFSAFQEMKPKMQQEKPKVPKKKSPPKEIDGDATQD
jgi:hypothetical protein